MAVDPPDDVPGGLSEDERHVDALLRAAAGDDVHRPPKKAIAALRHEAVEARRRPRLRLVAGAATLAMAAALLIWIGVRPPDVDYKGTPAPIQAAARHRRTPEALEIALTLSVSQPATLVVFTTDSHDTTTRLGTFTIETPGEYALSGSSRDALRLTPSTESALTVVRLALATHSLAIAVTTTTDPGTDTFEGLCAAPRRLSGLCQVVGVD